MNENIDLTKILKDCPKGFMLYSPIFGKVRFFQIDDNCEYKVSVSVINNDGHHREEFFSKEGYFLLGYDAKCLLFPSEELLDWSKFTAPWIKKERFDPYTLKPFDKVLVRDDYDDVWCCRHFSHIINQYKEYKYATTSSFYKCCIPYNDETKHLLNTKDEAPEYYKY